MSQIKFSLSDKDYKDLQTRANNEGMTIQDYIRYKLFNRKTQFTVEEAVRRAQNRKVEDELFTLPDLYEGEWTLARGMAGVFGKNFYSHITENPELGIRFESMCPVKRRAQYRYIKN